MNLYNSIYIIFIYNKKTKKIVKNDNEISIHLHPNNGLVAAAAKAT
jgi:hypothetical protein